MHKYGTKAYWQSEVDRLEKEMHEAPLAKIYQDHTGHKFVGVHTNAWATKSREWALAKEKLENA